MCCVSFSLRFTYDAKFHKQQGTSQGRRLSTSSTALDLMNMQPGAGVGTREPRRGEAFNLQERMQAPTRAEGRHTTKIVTEVNAMRPTSELFITRLSTEHQVLHLATHPRKYSGRKECTRTPCHANIQRKHQCYALRKPKERKSSS